MFQSPGGLRPDLTAAAQTAAATGDRSLLLPMTFNTPNGPQGEMQGENQGWAKVLEQLVRLLTGYTPMRFTPFYILKKHGETEQNTPPRWRTILGLEEIQYLPEDVNDPDQNVSLGKTAHEIWHVLFSRPELIFDEPAFIKNMAFQALWWAIEDPRVNIQGEKRHPGAREWLDAAMEKDYAIKDLAAEQKRWSEEIPLHLQFNYALIYEWWSGQPDPRVTDERVKEALAEAADPIQRAYSTADARKSFRIIRDEVWPIYKKLVDESYQNEQDKQKGDGEGEGEEGDEQDQQDQDGDSSSESQSQSGKPSQGKPQQGKPGQQKQQKKKQKPVSDKVKEEMEKKEKEFRDKHSSKMVDKPEKMSDAEKEAMKKDLERMRKKMGQKKDGQPQDGQPQAGEPQEGDGDGQKGDQDMTPQQKQEQRERLSKPDQREEVDSQDEAKYKDYFSEVRHLIPVMKAQFQQVLRRKIRRRFVHDRKSGDLDEEALNQIPGGKTDVFEESMIANKSLYRVSLLIDVSGSMSGEKKDHSIRAAVMMMEALDKLPGVSYEIVAFDDNPKVLKSYNERSTQAMKVAVVKGLLRNGGSTQSDKAVREAIQRIRMGRGDKLMMMMNDGDPDNNFDREAYRKMIVAAKDVEIHGIGLGPEAQLVVDLFPKGRGWWLNDVAECARRIREILKKKFLGGQ